MAGGKVLAQPIQTSVQFDNFAWLPFGMMSLRVFGGLLGFWPLFLQDLWVFSNGDALLTCRHPIFAPRPAGFVKE